MFLTFHATKLQVTATFLFFPFFFSLKYPVREYSQLKQYIKQLSNLKADRVDLIQLEVQASLLKLHIDFKLKLEDISDENLPERLSINYIYIHLKILSH